MSKNFSKLVLTMLLSNSLRELEKEQRTALARIIGAAVLFVLSYMPVLAAHAGGAQLWIAYTPVVPLRLAAYLVAGCDVIWRAVRNILHLEFFDESFLMTVASVGAVAIGEYPEAAAVMLFYQIGELCEDLAVDKSRGSISELMDIRPDYANIEKNGELAQVAPDAVQKGCTIIIKPGEKIPLDGVVLDGESSLNTTALTGESLPRCVKAGDAVASGCVNLTGLLRVRTTSTFSESTVSKILKLVENSEQSKGKTEKFITRFARVYTPAVVGAALLLALLPPLFFGGGWQTWFNRALIFLVISCPCALVVSVPLGFFGGIGGASKSGILVKGSNYLEALAQTKVVVFDKTGTLTKGTFAVTAIHPEIITQDKLLEIAALAENYSDHPISVSLRSAYNRAVDKSRLGKVENLSGQGIKAVVDGKTVYAGNDKLMKTAGVESRPCRLCETCRHCGTIIHVAVDGEYMGHIVIADEVKEHSKAAIAALKALGIRKTVMLTGDRSDVGLDVGGILGLDEVHAELLPAAKVDQVERLLADSNGKERVAFVGDGINDAPVLKRADVGIAMGALGSDAAIEAADVVLMDDDPLKIAAAIRIARRTLSVVKQNIVFALAVKALILLLGALGLASMWAAVFADVGVLILAVLNALRTMRAGS